MSAQLVSPDPIAIPEPRLLPDFDASHLSIAHIHAPEHVHFDLLRIASICTPPDFETAPVALLHRDNATQLRSWQEPLDFHNTLSPSDPLSYRISPSGLGNGLGMFAITTIERGDLILSERPLLVYPQILPFHSNRPRGQQYPELENAIIQLSPTSRQAFYSLVNSQPLEPSIIKGIIDTNALHLGCLPGGTHQYAAVCKDISRVNHSCSPNAVYRFDLDTFTFELRALFPILTDSQIFISYIDPALPRSARQDALSTYAFSCTCPSCSIPSPNPAFSQSETRRALIARADTDFHSRNAALERWVRAPSMPDDYVNRVDRMYMDLFEKEGLYYEPVWEGFAVRLCKACCAVEDVEGVKRWAGLAAALCRAYTGTDRGWGAVDAHPERTEWWGLRRQGLIGEDRLRI